MSRLTLQLTTLLSCLALVLCFTGNLFAVEVIMIEEHWQLNVGGPDGGRSAPQISMIMSPTQSLDGDFFSLTLNHWSYPNFAAGGLQVQRWEGDDCVAGTDGSPQNMLAHDGEAITWVQRLSIDEGILKFEVLNGNSQTWGTFGASNELTLSVPTTLSILNDYRPAVSLTQSGIGYAGNRVSSLTLTRIRWVLADGTEGEMVAPIDIDSDIDP